MYHILISFFFFLLLQWNPWSTGAMWRNRVPCSAPALPSWSPCRCSRWSASSRTCPCWPCSVPSRSGSTKMCCRQCKRPPRDTHSSELWAYRVVITEISYWLMDISPTHREYLDTDLALSQEKVQQLSTVAVAHVNALVTELRRLFLVEDLVDSIKFGVVLYCLTYVGAIFNGMTCVIIGKKEKMWIIRKFLRVIHAYNYFQHLSHCSPCQRSTRTTSSPSMLTWSWSEAKSWKFPTSKFQTISHSTQNEKTQRLSCRFDVWLVLKIPNCFFKKF